MYGGMVREGVLCYEDVRRRFDGERRNPWDEPECGHHYARAMSAWSGVVALSGFRYRGQEKAIVAAPRVRAANFSSFWSTGTGWGVFTQSTGERTLFTLSVLEGKLPCRSVELAIAIPAGSKSSALLGKKRLAHDLQKRDNRAIFTLHDPLEISEGDRIVLGS